MIDPAPASNRIALISLPSGKAFDAAAPVRRILGRWLGEWHVDQAVMAGCREIIVLGSDGGAEAIATRLAAEDAGLKVREMGGAHDLARLVSPDDQLLVLQGDLLPGEHDWTGDGWRQGVVATFAAVPAVELGFERIDLSRAWSGALIVPGKLVPGLLNLPEDSEAAPALLRIALQGAVPERRLDDSWLAHGGWQLAGDAQSTRVLEASLIARRVGEATAGEPLSARLARGLVRRWGARLLPVRAAMPLAFAGSAALGLGGLALAARGLAMPAFAATGLAATGLEFALALRGLRRSSHTPPQAEGWPRRVLRLGIDVALLACAFLLIEGRWYRQLFPPLVVLLALHQPAILPPRWGAVLRDRALVAITIGVLAGLVSTEVGVMVAALVLLVAGLVPKRG